LIHPNSLSDFQTGESIRFLRRCAHEAFSAGVTPKGQVSPITLKVLQDKFRIDASGARSNAWEEFKDEHKPYQTVIQKEMPNGSRDFQEFSHRLCYRDTAAINAFTAALQAPS
jgi:hypothetical protein